MSDATDRNKRIMKAARDILEKTDPKDENGFRVFISGKGGVGKTTITAMLSHFFAQSGYKVLAVDQDPQINLPFAIGIPTDDSIKVIPLTQDFDYVEEKTGARPGSGFGHMLSLNPDVSDVVDRFGIRGPDGVNILVMGTVHQASGGCLCPENTLLNSVIRYINLREDEVILMDTQAGVEHFGRSLARGFNQAVLVTDPTFNGVMMVKQAAQLSKELGVPFLHLVINRVRSDKDTHQVLTLLGEVNDLFNETFVIPYDEDLISIEPDVQPLIQKSLRFTEGVRNMQLKLQEYGNDIR